MRGVGVRGSTVFSSVGLAFFFSGGDTSAAPPTSAAGASLRGFFAALTGAAAAASASIAARVETRARACAGEAQATEGGASGRAQAGRAVACAHTSTGRSRDSTRSMHGEREALRVERIVRPQTKTVSGGIIACTYQETCLHASRSSVASQHACASSVVSVRTASSAAMLVQRFASIVQHCCAATESAIIHCCRVSHRAVAMSESHELVTLVAMQAATNMHRMHVWLVQRRRSSANRLAQVPTRAAQNGQAALWLSSHESMHST